MTEKWKRFDSEKLLLLLLLLLSAAVRIFFLFKFENLPGDAVGFIAEALRILENPDLLSNYDGNSSTLYKYALASCIYFWRDPILASRIFTSLFGIFLVVPYYGTLKVLFGRPVAFFSSLVLVFYPLHVIQSSMTTSDAVYYFFLFGSFYYFFSYKGSPQRFRVLLLSALSFNIASLLRFECWVFIPVLSLLLWPKGKGVALFFMVLCMVFPCLQLLLNQIFTGDCLYSFHKPGQAGYASIMAGRFSYDPRLWSWLAVLWRSSGPSLVIGGLSGIALAFLMRQKRQWSVFFLLLLLAFTVNTLFARMVTGLRYSITPALFLIPYAWFFAERILVLLRIKKRAWLALFLIFFGIDFSQTVPKAISQTAEMICVTPPGIINIAGWLKDHVRGGETMVIGADRNDVWQSNIALRSGIPPQRYFIVLTPLGFMDYPFKTKEGCQRYFLGDRTRYLVLNSEGYLQKILNLRLDEKKQTLGDISFEMVYEQEVLPGYGKYLIYRISYEN